MTWNWIQIVLYALVNGCLFYFYLLSQNGVQEDARLSLALAIAASAGLAAGVSVRDRS